MKIDRHAQLSSESGAMTLATAERDELGNLARRLVNVIPREMDRPEWIHAARIISCELPCRLRTSLRLLRRNSGSDGFILLRGLPVHDERLPGTPVAAESAQRSASHTASILVLIALQVGEIVAYREEKRGALVHDVVPVPGMERKQSNAGSDDLALHVENAFHVAHPDFVCLLCLRADHDRIAGLRVAACRKALSLLSERTKRILHEPRFATAAPASFAHLVSAATPHPILDGSPDDPNLRVDFTNTRPFDDEARLSMVELGKAMLAVQKTLVLTPGDMAIVDNRTTVHGRTAFRPRYDGNDRWLQRVFVQLDLRRSRGLRPRDGHVVHAG